MVDVHWIANAVAAAGSMVGSGAIVVCAEGRCMLDMALNAVRFYPQRILRQVRSLPRGLAKAGRDAHGMDRRRRLFSTDLQLLDELSHALKLTSICGLGQVVPVPIASVLKHFREVVDEHLNNRRCPAGVCFPRATRHCMSPTSVARAHSAHD